MNRKWLGNRIRDARERRHLMLAPGGNDHFGPGENRQIIVK